MTDFYGVTEIAGLYNDGPLKCKGGLVKWKWKSNHLLDITDVNDRNSKKIPMSSWQKT